jgi:hypothetical protein
VEKLKSKVMFFFLGKPSAGENIIRLRRTGLNSLLIISSLLSLKAEEKTRLVVVFTSSALKDTHGKATARNKMQYELSAN